MFDSQGARGVMVIVVGNGHGDTSLNPRWDWYAFHIALMHLFSLQLWVNSRLDWVLQPCEATSLDKGKLWIQTY